MYTSLLTIPERNIYAQKLVTLKVFMTAAPLCPRPHPLSSTNTQAYLRDIAGYSSIQQQ